MKTKTLFAIILAALMITACGGQSQTSAVVPATEETAGEDAAMDEAQAQEPVEAEQPAMEETSAEEAAPEQPIAADTAYTSPEGLFDLEIPTGWVKDEDAGNAEGAEVESFSSPDGHAHVQVLVSTVGADMTAVQKGQYALDFMKRLCGSDLRVGTDAIMDSGLERLDWRSDANKTSGSSYFDDKNNFLYYVNTYYEDAYESQYKDTLRDVVNSMIVHDEPVSVGGSGSNVNMTAHPAEQGLFTLKVPTDWTQAQDTSTLANSSIDTFTSQDGHAHVQMVVSKVEDGVTAVEKGQYTLDYMKRLYGKDLHVAKDVTLKNGLERLDWWVDGTKTSGSTYFNMKNNYLYFFSTYSEDDYADIYTATLGDVADSFSE